LPLARNIAWQIGRGRPDLIDDLIGVAYLATCGAVRRYDYRGPLEPLIAVAVRRACWKWLQREEAPWVNQHESAGDRIEDLQDMQTQATDTDPARVVELRDELREALEELDVQQRAIVQALADGHSAAEAGRRVGGSKMTTSRAMAEVRKRQRARAGEQAE
jgi:RNA polymerase sigma factor (sigma-70 family)